MAFTYSDFKLSKYRKKCTDVDTHALAECQHRAFTRPKKEGLLCKNKFSSLSDNESTKPWRPTIYFDKCS